MPLNAPAKTNRTTSTISGRKGREERESAGGNFRQSGGKPAGRRAVPHDRKGVHFSLPRIQTSRIQTSPIACGDAAKEAAPHHGLGRGGPCRPCPPCRPRAPGLHADPAGPGGPHAPGRGLALLQPAPPGRRRRRRFTQTLCTYPRPTFSTASRKNLQMISVGRFLFSLPCFSASSGGGWRCAGAGSELHWQQAGTAMQPLNAESTAPANATASKVCAGMLGANATLPQGKCHTHVQSPSPASPGPSPPCPPPCPPHHRACGQGGQEQRLGKNAAGGW